MSGTVLPHTCMPSWCTDEQLYLTLKLKVKNDYGGGGGGGGGGGALTHSCF